MKAKKWVLVRYFQDAPKDGDFELRDEELPELGAGDVLLQGISWNVDPYIRVLSRSMVPGDTVPGQQLARIIESKNEDFPVGKLLICESGWRSHTVLNPARQTHGSYDKFDIPAFTTPPDTGELSTTLTLGALGIHGATAYFGFLEVCSPQAGEIVLVTSAAGAIGSLVGQIAKLKGCTVVGFAGSDAKVKHVKEDLGFDFAYNYKKIDVSEALKEAAPEGLDCYFDNVGGEFASKVINCHMRDCGRVAVCGYISAYSEDTPGGAAVSLDYSVILMKQLQLAGFVVYRWADRYHEAWRQIADWLKQGKIECREHVTEGFENLYSAFQGILNGDNIGKSIVNASE